MPLSYKLCKGAYEKALPNLPGKQLLVMWCTNQAFTTRSCVDGVGGGRTQRYSQQVRSEYLVESHPIGIPFRFDMSRLTPTIPGGDFGDAIARAQATHR